jgi:hypothetical protein
MLQTVDRADPRGAFYSAGTRCRDDDGGAGAAGPLCERQLQAGLLVDEAGAGGVQHETVVPEKVQT